MQNKVNGSFLLLCLVKNILWNHQIFIILDIEIVMLLNMSGNLLIPICNHCFRGRWVLYLFYLAWNTASGWDFRGNGAVTILTLNMPHKCIWTYLIRVLECEECVQENENECNLILINIIDLIFIKEFCLFPCVFRKF